MSLKIISSERLSLARQRGRRGQRGFIHILLLVFVVLGLSMWGASELQQRAQESASNRNVASGDNLQAAKQKLIDYALLAPEAVDIVGETGRYNAYQQSGARVPFRYFSLPCPDVGGDGNLDGFSDVLVAPCSAAGAAVLSSGSRYGRLPWRDDKNANPADFTYVRGLGGVDFRDGFNQRLWYAAATPLLNPVHSLSPHVLLRLTTGWLSARNEDGDLLSDRVAAAVITPGLFGAENSGGRISEDALEEGGVVIPSTLIAAYLSTLSYADSTSPQEEIFIREVTDGSDSALDRVEYLTIDELAADGREGIAVLEDAPHNLYDVVAGEDGFLGAVDILDEHLQRHGFLPQPAMLDSAAAERRLRAAGAPPVTSALVFPDEVRNVKIQTSLNLSVAIRVSDLPPVYLTRGVTLHSASNDAIESLPPYGSALGELDTALNYATLTTGVRNALIAGNHYPINGIGGLNSPAIVAADLEETFAPAIQFAQTRNLSLAAGSDLAVILAESAYGYFVNDTLITLISYADNSGGEAIAELPPSAAKVHLPAGTRLTLDGSGIEIRFPSVFEIGQGATYDLVTGNWTLDSTSDSPVQLIADSALWVTLTISPPQGFPVAVGDIGFLPIDSVSVQNVAAGVTVSLGGNATAMSYLPADMTLVYVNAANYHQSLFPFFPSDLLHSVDIMPDPLALSGEAGSGVVNEFTVPAGTRVFYPSGGEFVIGDQFAFPKGSIFQFPAGGETNQGVNLNSASPDHILPGGRRTALTLYQTVTLVHGGLAFAAPDGSVTTAGVGTVYPRRGEDGKISDAIGESFDIEVRGGAVYNGGATVTTPHSIRPLLGKRTESPTPVRITALAANYYSDSYIRAGFLTRPRYFPVWLGGTLTALASPYQNDPLYTQLSSLRGIDDNGVAQPAMYNGSTAFTLSLVMDEDTQFFLPPRTTLSVRIGTYTDPDTSALISAVIAVELPAGTGIFDIDAAPSFTDITIASGTPRLIVTGNPMLLPLVPLVSRSTVDVRLRSHFALFPETDMYINTGTQVSVIQSGSVVDLLDNVIYPPRGVQRIPRVAAESGVRSRGTAYMYLESAVTLLTDRGAIDVAVDTTGAYTVEVTPAPASSLNLLIAVQTPTLATLYGRPVAQTLTVAGNLVLPARTYIQLPPGAEIDLLSDTNGMNNNVALADYARLPDGAMAFVLPGATVVVDNLVGSATVSTPLSGPLHLHLTNDRGGAAAFVNTPAYLSEPPRLFFTDDVHLYDVKGTDDERLYAPLPAVTQLDLYGRMETRLDGGLYADLMPLDSRQLFEDFPMLYAVAPECRQRHIYAPGTDCAEAEGEGLEFELQQGEEYLLREPLDIPSAALITSAYPNVSLAIEVRNINAATVRSSHTAAAVFINSVGLIMMDSSASPAYPPSANDQLVVRVDGSYTQTELRTYINSAVTFNMSLDDYSYVAVDDALTLYSGGYVGANYANAAGGATLNAVSQLTLGFGARLQELEGGEKLFGNDSDAVMNFSGGGGAYNATVNLSDYVIAPISGGYDFTLTTALPAGVAAYDRYGETQVDIARAVTVITTHETFALSTATPLYYDTRLSIIHVGTHSMPMQSGYLWQGYVPPSSEFMMQQDADRVNAYVVTIQTYENIATGTGATYSTVYANIIITTGVFPNSRLDLRIQSTVAQLNSWGSGLERPEGLDRNSYSYVQQTLLADGSPSGNPYFSYGGGRYIRQDALDVSFVYSDYFLSGNTYTGNQVSLVGTPGLADTQAYETYAGLIDGRDPRGLNRSRTSLSMRVAVRNPDTGAVSHAVADWSPIVVFQSTGGFPPVTVTGYVRVNSGSNSPIVDSGLANAAAATLWTQFYDALDQEAAYQTFGWLGRNNLSSTPEDGFMRLNINGTMVTVVFNVPHTDIVGTGEKYRIWPSSEHAQAHPNSADAVGVPIASAGASYDIFSPQVRPAYAPGAYTVAFNAPLATVMINSTPAGVPQYSRDFAANTTVNVTAETDWLFYIDSAYHNNTGGVYSPVQPQVLRFGDAFRIEGPAAIVPPFGGRSEDTTRAVYAERSQLLTRLFPALPTLHPVYDDRSGDCVGTNDCENMYNNPHWFPLLGGAAAFEGLEIAFPAGVNRHGNDNVRLIFPEPRTTVPLAAGGTAEVHAGSIIYPKRNLIYASTPLPPANYALYANSGSRAIVHVDSSPVQRQLNYEVRRQQPQALDGGIFNYAPIAVTVGTDSYVVEPLGFTAPGPHFEFDPRAVASTLTAAAYAGAVYPLNSYGPNTDFTPPATGFQSPLCLAAGDADHAGTGIFTRRIVGCDGLSTASDRWTLNPYWYRYGVIHEGVWNTRLMPDSSEFRNWEGLRGGPTPNRNSPPAARSLRNYTHEPIRYDGSFNRGAIADDDGLALLTTYYSGAPLFSSALNYEAVKIYTSSTGGASSTVTIALPSRNTDAPLGNPASYQWQVAGDHLMQLGVADITNNTSALPFTAYARFSYSTVGVRISTDAAEFDMLRLAHRVEVPSGTGMEFGGFSENQYAASRDSFFTFPAGSEAIVLNADLGSWLAAHPYIGLYQAGLSVRAPLGSSGYTVPADNDSFQRIPLAGRHVVHYQRSESSQHKEPLSAVPIHTNVWVRLPKGGRLENRDTGDIIMLPPQSLVNPIIGTYISIPGSHSNVGARSNSLYNQYRAPSTVSGNIRLVRPALILPAGGRLVVGAAGGIVRNVKAAVLFSLTPLEAVQCPTGGLDAANGQSGATVGLNQAREGIQENRYAVAGGRQFGLGHPCAWLDEPENLDGDRTFLYRSRRRYLNDDLRVVPQSNDRTYLLGGRLELYT